jgi:uncharacterized alpha-E superfamily protein
MLGRTAASLYWMSRYVERAESMARLIEVGYRISLMPSAIEGHLDEWRSTLRSTACEQGYDQKHPEINGQQVIAYLLFDEDNPSSVRSCLMTARNNARAVRTAITRDVWESLNSTWNEFAQIKPSAITSDRLPGFLEWIRQRSMMFRGALLGTMLRTDNYFFSQLGNFIERADTTARILDVKYYILLPRPNDVGSELDMQQWAQVLRSVSAHRAYRWFYRDSRYRPWLIAEFLILKDEMPRSLVFSYHWINSALEGLAELYDRRYACHEQAAAIYRRLKQDSMDEIFQEGLHEFLQEFLRSNAKLSEAIAHTYNFP